MERERERDEGRRYILGVSKNLEEKTSSEMTTTTTTIYSYFTYMSVGRRSEWFDISDDYYYYHPQPKKETLYLPHRKKNGKRLFGNRTVCWSAGGIIYNHVEDVHTNQEDFIPLSFSLFG
jgi:hypothetical protein